MEEGLVTLALVAVMLVIEIKPTKLEFLLPSMPHKSCTPLEDMNIKQWLAFLFYHHNNKFHLAFNIFSFLWKGTLLEGCIGSRQFSLLILGLLLIYDGMMVLASLLWQFLAGSDFCLLTYHSGMSGLLFALIIPLNINYEVYRSIRFVPSQSLYRVTLSAINAVEIAILYCLYPRILTFHSLLCGILSGFLYSYQFWLFRNWNSWLFVNKWWYQSLLKIIKAKNTEQVNETIEMVWSCHVCTYENSAAANPYDCAICEAPRFEMIGSLSELHVNPDKSSLVWNCRRCTFENGVYFHGCEICGTPRPVLG